jgi:ABC-2 type transport system permease protein
MTRALRHSWHITLRYLRAFVRQPAWVLISLVQPVIWLLLFGGLFKRVVDIPGFHAGSYIVFLTPGVIVMTAISSAGWNGMAFIDDMNRGVMDRFLVSPVWRGALNLGSMAYGVATIVVQSLIIVGLAYATGAHFRNGAAGIAVLLLVAALLGASFAALSNALALVVRKRESLIGAVTLVMLPLTFMSAAFMQLSLAPGWIQDVARANPVNWGVTASRSAASQATDWTLVGSRIGFLAALLLVSTWLATRAFRAYQRSV